MMVMTLSPDWDRARLHFTVKLDKLVRVDTLSGCLAGDVEKGQ